MNNLLIFIDETGTMPPNKENKIFLAAGIGTLNDYPLFDKKSGHKQWLIGQLLKNTIIPFISYIDPDKLNINKLQEKFDKIEKMALTNLQITGKNKDYVSEYGLKRKNMIWVNTISICINQIILIASFKGSINHITVYLDQKTLHTTSLNMLNFIIKTDYKKMISSFDKTDGVPKKLKELAKSNCRWRKNDVRVLWSNETEAFPATCGLDLAHYLGYHFFNDYHKSDTGENFCELMGKAGYTYYSIETNSLLTGEISKKAIQDWEINIGLKNSV